MFFDFKKVSPLRPKKAANPVVVAPVSPQEIVRGRRAFTLLPDAVSESIREVKDTLSVRFHHLLINLEGQERSGCLKITSDKHKARSALLLYKGRVVGSVYGQKSMMAQYLAQDAHKCALNDLAAPGNTVDAYDLPEDLVLASAALFSGQQLNLDESAPVQSRLEQAGTTLVTAGLPGCIVVTTSAHATIGLIYVCRGRIVAVYSHKHGWQQANLNSARRLLGEPGAGKVYAAILPISQGAKIGFSLTGLGDKRKEVVSTINLSEPLSSSEFVQTQRMEISGGSARKMTMGHTKPIGSRARRTEERSTFAIAPN